MKSNHGLNCLILTLLSMLPVGAGAKDLPDVKETQSIAKEAYLYGFPMVMNYKTMVQYAVDTENPEYKGPFNEVACEARLFTPDDRAVVHEIHRVLKPGGKLVIADMHTPTTRMGWLVSWTARWFFMQPEIAENIHGVLPRLMRAAGFRPPETRGRYLGYINIFSCTKPGDGHGVV